MYEVVNKYNISNTFDIDGATAGIKNEFNVFNTDTKKADKATKIIDGKISFVISIVSNIFVVLCFNPTAINLIKIGESTIPNIDIKISINTNNVKTTFKNSCVSFFECLFKYSLNTGIIAIAKEFSPNKHLTKFGIFIAI
jgi:hypothetical protein